MAIISEEPGQPLYLNRVAAAYAGLAQTEQLVFLDTVNPAGEVVAHAIQVPPSASCDAYDLKIRDAYILAHLTNLFVTFGSVRLEIFLPLADKLLAASVEKAVGLFDFDRQTNDRTGLGSFANYIARINRAAGSPRFSVAYRDSAVYRQSASEKHYRLFNPDCLNAERDLLRRAVDAISGKTFVGLDVGGTGIKAAAVVDGEIAVSYSYMWHPATFTATSEIVGPIVAIARLLAAAASLYKLEPRHPLLAELRRCDCPGTPDLWDCRELTAALGRSPDLLDGLVCGFPDIVINDKVVGGEVYKLRGIRRRDPAAYDADFAAIMNLDDALRPLVKPDGATVVMNDGFATLFVISAERLYAGDAADSCLLVHTIGTEMGTGIICPFGAEQNIPMEGYNWIIDLSQSEETLLDADDVRSSVNFNTGVPGSVQKVISQSGLIRLAVRNFQREDPAQIDKLLEDGLLVRQQRGGSECLLVSSVPRDRRSDLVRRLVAMLKDGNPQVRDAYREIGMALGVLVEAMDAMLAGVGHNRFVSGGIVAEDECFRHFRAGLREAYPAYDVRRLDAGACATPLLGALAREDIGYMTAVGSCYVASKRLLQNRRQPL